MNVKKIHETADHKKRTVIWNPILAVYCSDNWHFLIKSLFRGEKLQSCILWEGKHDSLVFRIKRKKVFGMKTSIKTSGAFSQIPILITVLIFPILLMVLIFPILIMVLIFPILMMVLIFQISKPILLRLIMT